MKVAKERDVRDYADRHQWLLIGFLEVDETHFYTWITPSGRTVSRRFRRGEAEDE